MDSYYILLFIIIIVLLFELNHHRRKEKFKNKYKSNISSKTNKNENIKVPENFRNYNRLKIDKFDDHNKCFTCSKN